MSSKDLGNLMRCSVIAAAACGMFLCAYILPLWGQGIVASAPELESWFFPWLVFSWLLAIPCFAILVFIWKVSRSVMNETVFTAQTANWVKTGAILLLSDAAFLLLGNSALLFCGMNHPGVLLFSAIGATFAAALALLAAVLSRYLTKAAVLQEESEGTL